MKLDKVDKGLLVGIAVAAGVVFLLFSKLAKAAPNAQPVFTVDPLTGQVHDQKGQLWT